MLKLSGIVNDSIVDGPGLRLSIFTQGCPHHCPGCHNPETHSFKGGKHTRKSKLIKKIDANPLLAGVTFSGGEPFCQAKDLIPIAKHIKEKGLELACYSGYTFEALSSGVVPHAKDLLKYVDVLIDGRFILDQRSLSLKFKGSKNQRTIDVQRSLENGIATISTDPRWV